MKPRHKPVRLTEADAAADLAGTPRPDNPTRITLHELRFALNYHSIDAKVGMADNDLAGMLCDTVKANRGVHPSLI